MYAAVSTCPDLAYAAGVLGRVVSNPHTEHMRAGGRVLRYLQGTPNLGLVYEAGPIELKGYADSDYAGDLSTRKSTSGVSPNGMPRIDSMVSTIGHEITEAATDPDVATGWLTSEGNENADLCAWQFGDFSQDTDGDGNTYDYNMVGNGGMRFMIAANWDLVSSSCQIKHRLCTRTGIAEGSAAGQQKAAESNKKALRLRALQEKVLTWHQQNVYSPEALAASAALLEQNPDVYVTWNYRKKAFVHRCGALEAGADGCKEGKAVQRGAEVKEGEKEAQGKEGQGEGGKEAQGEGGSGEGNVGTDGAMGEAESAGGRDGNGEESEVGEENDGKKGDEQERVEREREERARREEERREEERKIEEAKGKLADEELKLIEAALRTNPKCYGAWHHRKWLFALSSTEPLPSLGASLGPSLQQVRINLRSEARIAREQKLLGMMLSADDRNFHAWDYWRFISHVEHMSPSKDLEFTMERINANFSNYSAWHSRRCAAELVLLAGEERERRR
ncbi:unnamed protein product [Closterium sp. NIES-53]